MVQWDAAFLALVLLVLLLLLLSMKIGGSRFDAERGWNVMVEAFLFFVVVAELLVVLPWSVLVRRKEGCD